MFKAIQRVVRTPSSAYTITNEILMKEKKCREEFVYEGVVVPGNVQPFVL